MFKDKWAIRLLFVENEGEDDDLGGGDGKDEGTDEDKGKETKESKSLSDSVEEAAREVEAKLKGGKKEISKKEESSDDKDEEDTEDDEDDEKEDEEKELTDEEKVHAKTLFRLLTNPKSAPNALRTLVEQSGMKIQEAETKKEETKIIKSIKEMVKEELGEEYKFLGDKLGTVLEKLIVSQVKEQTKDIRERQNAEADQRTMETVKAAQEKVKSEYVQVSDKVLREVLRIQEEGEAVVGPKTSAEKFFKTCVIMAAENLGITLVKKAPGTKVETKERSKSPLDKLSESRGSHKEGVKSVQVKSMDDAIAAAVESVSKSSKTG